VKLHVVSDLHLSVAGLELPETAADMIVLAGDIARPFEACAWAQRLGKPVIYVAGNHEFYGGSIDGTIAALREHSSDTAIRLLETDELIVESVRFLGTTLWSDFSNADEAERVQTERLAMTMIRDFSRIRAGSPADRPFSPADSTKLFRRSAAWLQRKLDEPFDGPTVVVTHHAPSSRSIHPRFAGSPLTPCFVSDVERMMDGDRVALWIHGHTHDSFDYSVQGTRVLCNPRGYAKDGINENAAFDAGLVVQI
jgi:predicted phosphodiesterase